MERREHDRLPRPGRRQSDHRQPAAENRRVLLVGRDEAWRLLAAYVFEEAAYVVYAAEDRRQGVALATRLLPDAVVVQTEALETLDTVAWLSAEPSTCDIPVIVLMSSLESTDARRVRAAGGVTLLAHADDVEALVGEVDTLVAVVPRAKRALKRRLLDLHELAQHYTPDGDGQARLRRLIDHLQVAIFAVDDEGHCIAASQGATALTGYSRRQLLNTSVFQSGFAGGQVSDERWQHFLANRHYDGTTTITNRAGEDVMVHAAAVAAILPGVHVAAVVIA
jgi:PAS domain S-box-containing protein